MVAKIHIFQFGHVALFVFFCRELSKNFPKNPRKKCWSQSCEISNWNILQDFKRIFDNFFLPEIFQWHLKTLKDDRSVLLRVIVFRQRTVCYDVRHTWTWALPSVFVRRSIDVIILVFLSMASVWIQLPLLDQKNISVLAMEWLISRTWTQRRRLNRVLLLNFTGVFVGLFVGFCSLQKRLVRLSRC